VHLFCPLPDQSRLSDSNKRWKQPTRRICARRRRPSGSARRRQRAPCRPGWSGRRRQFQFYTRALASVLALDPGPPACLHVGGPANVFFHIFLSTLLPFMFFHSSLSSLFVFYGEAETGDPARCAARHRRGLLFVIFVFIFLFSIFAINLKTCCPRKVINII